MAIAKAPGSGLQTLFYSPYRGTIFGGNAALIIGITTCVGGAIGALYRRPLVGAVFACLATIGGIALSWCAFQFLLR